VSAERSTRGYRFAADHGVRIAPDDGRSSEGSRNTVRGHSEGTGAPGGWHDGSPGGRNRFVAGLRKEYGRHRPLKAAFCVNISRRPPAGMSCVTPPARVVLS